MKNKNAGLIQNIKSIISYWFSIQNIDDHYVIKLFGAKICKKHKIEFDLKDVTEYGITTEKRNPKLIVSLTTFPARINTVYKTISTLLQQTVKPDEVVLWLADSQFPEHQLPVELTRLQDYGLTIKWCEDIMSFKKLVPSLREYPDDIIVTADDDIFYPTDFLESLYGEYLKYPEFIHANRAFLIKKFRNKFSINARSYVYDDSYRAGFHNEFMTGYGTLFPPKSLHSKVLDSETFMKIMPTNDDVWFWSMAVKNGTKIKVNPKGYSLKLLFDRTVQDCALWKLNMNNTQVGTNGGDGVNMMCDNDSVILNNLLSEFEPKVLKYIKSKFR